MKKTLAILAVLGLALVGWDVALVLDDTPGNTISGSVNQVSYAVGPAAGYICGHLFAKARAMDAHPPAWVKATGGILSLGLGFFLQSGLAGFLIGALLGAYLWPNSGRAGP